jgi:hypothetical protein
VLSKIIKRLANGPRHRSSVVKNSNEAVSLWQDTGQVYYLENTIKLTYTSNSGEITLEKLTVDGLRSAVQAIDAMPDHSPFARANVANQDDAFVISICGVTWQKKNDSVRIKAIPEAALLRSKTACFGKSQAVFRHALALEHDDLLTPAPASGQGGAFTYNRISLAAFTDQIARANARITPKGKHAITVGVDNFSTAFTEHEQRAIDTLLSSNDDNKLQQR